MHGLIRPDIPKPLHSRRAPSSCPREAFIPDGSPYLGQAVPGEPVRQSDVFSRTGDYRDETSIRCGLACRPLPVIIL
jgi:hypothetical protein